MKKTKEEKDREKRWRERKRENENEKERGREKRKEFYTRAENYRQKSDERSLLIEVNTVVFLNGGGGVGTLDSSPSANAISWVHGRKISLPLRTRHHNNN